ncbi:hypothetical protein [Flexivirga meconopsidis]|uniref:hypothetical protein n=1 Tax=Flexivirga meconopsidis TaxID=2977121 RepID=UPI00223F4D76|nr:hypothetical protein [Flexivirga meconopsidis]
MVNRSSAYLQHWAGWDRGGRQVHARAGGPAWRYPVKRLLTTDPCIAYQYNETWHNGTLLVNTFRFCAR